MPCDNIFFDAPNRQWALARDPLENDRNKKTRHFTSADRGNPSDDIGLCTKKNLTVRAVIWKKAWALLLAFVLCVRL